MKDNYIQSIFIYLFICTPKLFLHLSISLQVAIAQFSDDARTEFQLSSHSNKEALLEAIQKISYKGGNTKTGESCKLGELFW